MRQWTLDEATAALPEVCAVVRKIRELVTAARVHAVEHGGADGAPVSGNGHGPKVRGDDRELRALLAELDRQGVIVRDPARGLIDFPAVSASGRTYLLCYLEGEDAIEWWHWPEDGFAGRTPLSKPPA